MSEYISPIEENQEPLTFKPDFDLSGRTLEIENTDETWPRFVGICTKLNPNSEEEYNDLVANYKSEKEDGPEALEAFLNSLELKITTTHTTKRVDTTVHINPQPPLVEALEADGLQIDRSNNNSSQIELIHQASNPRDISKHVEQFKKLLEELEKTIRENTKIILTPAQIELVELLYQGINNKSDQPLEPAIKDAINWIKAEHSSDFKGLMEDLRTVGSINTKLTEAGHFQHSSENEETIIYFRDSNGNIQRSTIPKDLHKKIASNPLKITIKKLLQRIGFKPGRTTDRKLDKVGFERIDEILNVPALQLVLENVERPFAF